MYRSTYLPFLVATIALCSGCMSFQPVPDPSIPVVLSLPLDADAKEGLAPYPVTLVGFPSYLNHSQPVVMKNNGILKPIAGYYWVEPLSNSIADELSILLSSSLENRENAHIRVRFYRFSLKEDGSGEAILEWKQISLEQQTLTESSHRIQIDDIWNPADVATFFDGAVKLLQATGGAIQKELDGG